MKYPIGIQTFDKIIEGGFVYVDKTDLVYKLVTEGTIYFLSRPRRFGKSLLMSTLESYFLGKQELFKGLKIDALEKDWNEYPVFHVDFSKGNFKNPKELAAIIENFIQTEENKYGKKASANTISDRFEYILEQAHEQIGRKAVVLIDEYDKPLLDVMETGSTVIGEDGKEILLEEYNRQLLKGFYSVFKAADKHLQFVLLTGVTKFSQVSVFSGFNQPEDISLNSDYEALCGITRKEIDEYFEGSIAELAKEQNLSIEETNAKLQRLYDGYHFGKKMTDIYNPFSLLRCFKSRDFSHYWFSTGTPEYLMRLMAYNNVNINELISREYSEAEFVDFKADKQMPLPMLYQSGYLTIKDYDPELNLYRLDFPNEEVRGGLLPLLGSQYFKDSDYNDIWLIDAVKQLRRGELETFVDNITALLAGISYEFHEKKKARESERHFQYTFYLILLMIGKYNTVVERRTSQGRIDCVMECPDYVYIFEFKRDGSADEALKQINEKGYAKPYLTDPRPLYKVGINFSTATGTIEEMKYELIER